MKYPMMSATDAAKYIDLVRKGEPASPASFTKQVGSGDRLSNDTIASAVQKIRAIKAEYPEKLRPKDPKGGDFEAGVGFELTEQRFGIDAVLGGVDDDVRPGAAGATDEAHGEQQQGRQDNRHSCSELTRETTRHAA